MTPLLFTAATTTASSYIIPIMGTLRQSLQTMGLRPMPAGEIVRETAVHRRLVEKIAQMSEENSAAAQSTSDTAGELAHLAQEMQQVVAQYRV